MKKGILWLGLLMALISLFWGGAFSPANAAQDAIKWKMTTTWTPNMMHIEGDRFFVKTVNELARGKLEIKFFEGGSLVPPFEVFDSVASGTVQAGGDWPGYWAGKEWAFDPLGGVSLVLSPVDFLVWIWQAGGFELYQEVYGKFGLVYLPTVILPMESGIRSNKPINSLADLKGMKVRAAGRVAGAILKQIGAAHVMLAGGEVYQALEKGVIDAAEMSMPQTDWGLGLQEVTKYWCVPNWVNTGNPLGVMVNKKAWDKLPDHLKTTLRTAALATCAWSFTFYEHGAIGGTKKFVDAGIKVTRLSNDDLKTLRKIAQKKILETCEGHPLFAKVIHSQYTFLKDVSKWRAFSSPFSYGENYELPDLDAIKAHIK